MKYMNHFILSTAMLAAAGAACATEAPQQRSLQEINIAAQAITQNIASQTAAIKACNAQGKLYGASGTCETAGQLNLNTVLSNVSFEDKKCASGRRSNGWAGSTANVYFHYSCPNRPLKVDITGSGANKTLYVETCRNYWTFYAHGKEFRASPLCPWSSYAKDPTPMPASYQ